jgi:hypothetical protein
MATIDQAPVELADAVREFFPPEEWDNAVSIAQLESGWSAFAQLDTRDQLHPCNAVLRTQGGVMVTAEWSIGWFQINACNLPIAWSPAHLFNTRHNVGTAHDLWARRGWQPWMFSARSLGLL